MQNNDYILRSDAKMALTALPADLDAETVQRCIEAMNNPKATDVELKRRWISVTERFPKPVSAQNRRKTKPVLLYSPKGGFYVGWYFGEDYRGQHIFTNRTSKDSLQYITTKVTHWTTLPESPEGEDDAVSCN